MGVEDGVESIFEVLNCLVRSLFKIVDVGSEIVGRRLSRLT